LKFKFFPSSLFLSFSFTPPTSFAASQNIQSDGTYETVSQMIFSATRFENNALMRCEADNIVMRNEMDKPLHDTLSLEVMCKLVKLFSLKISLYAFISRLYITDIVSCDVTLNKINLEGNIFYTETKKKLRQGLGKKN
jgi:hypothetical protein